ncbi:glycoside hydrolase family 5 protein [Arthrobacter halodurans]|uniref:Cellulase family glycosylhydrolase n=1 Tax=Arthrobacter halodurans TaxID=516699 RepID=A0ABV4UT50_9MICC
MSSQVPQLPLLPAAPRRRRRPARSRRLWALMLVSLLAVTGCTPGSGGDDAAQGAEPAAASNGLGTDGFVRAAGSGLEVDGGPVRLEAVNFSNLYHRDIDGSELLESPHHSEQDFARVKELGFNSVRFAFDGDWYAEDPEVFWQWLDRNIGWARQHEVRLILDLHTPIGGFWLDPTSEDVSFDLWSDPELQQANADLWTDIAARYKDETAIAAYDLLNEPVTSDSTGEQWEELAQRLVDAVRAEDPHHLLVVGGVYGVGEAYGAAGIDPHFLVDDDNVMYDFHFYEPIKYTHQYASWVEGPIQDGGRYPDPDVILPTGERTYLTESAISTPSLPVGTSGWAAYDSGLVEIEDESAIAAMPLVVAQGGMRGTAYFDAVRVTEYDADGQEIRRVVDDQLDGDGTLDWYQWSSDDAAPAPEFARESSGREDGASLSVTDATRADALAGWSNDAHLFKVVPGNQYRIQGYMRGEDIAPASAAASPQIVLKLDVYAETEGAAGGGFLPRDKTFLEYQMEENLAFGAEHGVPMSVMEFGAVRQAFQMEGKGGEQWVGDMLSLLEENNLSFSYWEYHGTEMGLYLSGSGEPGEPNTALQDLLRRELGGEGG